ncbi:unnamed protein product, partial [Phaeothamnion confervicola]
VVTLTWAKSKIYDLGISVRGADKPEGFFDDIKWFCIMSLSCRRSGVSIAVNAKNMSNGISHASSKHGLNMSKSEKVHVWSSVYRFPPSFLSPGFSSPVSSQVSFLDEQSLLQHARERTKCTMPILISAFGWIFVFSVSHYFLLYPRPLPAAFST